MKRLFKHIANNIACFYKHRHWASDYVAQSYFLLCFAITCYALTITHVLLSFFSIKTGIVNVVILLFCIPLIIEIVRFDDIFPNARKDFNKFESKRDRNNNEMIIEGLLFSFIIISLISCMVVLLTSC